MRFGFWQAHPKWFWWGGGILIALTLGYFAFDREPPFRQINVDPIAPVRAGEEVVITADVKRENSRRCSATVFRELLDANGVLHTPFADKSQLSAASILRQDQREVNKLRRAFPLPDNLPSGKTSILSHLAYRCYGNPFHAIWPILVDLDWTFQVLPPAPKTIVMLPPIVDASKPKGTPEDPVSVTIEPPKGKP